MDNTKNDEYYVNKVIEHIDSIILYTQDKDYNSFINNSLLIDAVLFRLVQMAENINHISKEYKNNHLAIKWGQIAGFRNGIVHNYGNTDYSIVYEIISEDIYNLKENLLKK